MVEKTVVIFGGAGGGTQGQKGSGGYTAGSHSGPSGYFGIGAHTANEGGGGRRWLVWRACSEP